MMRTITARKISEAVSKACLKANIELRKDVLARLRAAYSGEKNGRSRRVLSAIIENAACAAAERLTICQDTGMAVVFVEIGQDVHVEGDLTSAITRGVEEGYKKGSFRNSIVKDPLSRGKPGYSPVVIHTDIVKGRKLKLTVLPKGFGCENKSQLKMFNPTASIDQVKAFIVDSVKAAGPDGCPPYVVGVGIGGTADYACLLAKKALLLPIAVHGRRSTVHGSVGKLERELEQAINGLNIGPMGLGGKNTCLAVKIKTYATHIAGLPVAVNISCHATRSATIVL